MSDQLERLVLRLATPNETHRRHGIARCFRVLKPVEVPKPVRRHSGFGTRHDTVYL